MNDIRKPEPETSGAPLEQILAVHGRGGRLRRWRLPIVVAILAVLALVYFQLRGRGEPRGPEYVTQEVTTGTLVVKVSATGKLEPTNKVNVGSELSGTVAEVYVDDDDHVTKGQVLARLDLAKFEDAAAKSRGALAVAQASQQQAGATVAEAQAKLDRYREVSRLSGGKVPSKTEMEAAEAELARAKANAASAAANIAEAKAALRTDETNLGKARIRSPIDGVVLERAVDPGQTVAASLQAVTLFTIAEDLSKMELKVDVDEADVGQVKPGQKAIFTVDAWPGRRFEATITRVGFNATDSDGVVSYPAVLQVENDDLSLRPGMTGNAEITTLVHDGAVLVPNAALRFSPAPVVQQKRSGGGVFSALMPRPPATTKPRAQTPAADGTQRVWVLRNGEAVPLSVRTGASNGRVTEVLSGELKPGMQVIIETAGPKA